MRLDMSCGVPGCRNEAVRVLTHKRDATAKLSLCAHHVRRAILYLTPEQIGSLVFPPDESTQEVRE